jgi:two-component system phosphate regulon sensor histidine kinase PhoR
MKSTFFSRIFIGYFVIILMLSLAGLLAFSQTSKNLYRETIAGNLKDAAVILRGEAGRALAGRDIPPFHNRAREIAREMKMRITLVDAAGVVLADSHENPATMENHRNRPEFVEALSGRTGISSRFGSTMGQEALYVAVPVEHRGTITGAIRTSMVLKDVRLPRMLTIHMIEIAAALSLLALLAAFLIAKSASQPIRRLREAASSLAAGNFDTRVFLDRDDEFRTLADTFNAMSQDLKNSFETIARGRSDLKGIIDSLREGLVAIDKKGAVVYCNKSMRAIFGREDVTEGQPYWEVFGHGALVELMDKAKKGETASLDETVIGDRIYLSSAVRLEPQGETVMVFNDITGIRQLEKIKKDLIANVSHELRTPLTSIKGFAETLEEEVGEPQRHYVEIIRRNTDRLIRIVEDLLVLSKIEEKQAGLEPDNVDLADLVEDTARLFRPEAAKKGLALTIDLPAALPPVVADRFKLEQMLTNLLDNAVKYTDAGEVRVAVKADAAVMTIEVHDTGIGIPADKIPRIFERFYVVDKSRSRRMGGTGLGLSIVKHIVLLHGGEIRVESAPGKGTHFFITLPLRSAQTS